MSKKSFFAQLSHFLKLHNTTKLQKLYKPLKKFPAIWTKIYYKQYPRYPSYLLPVVEYVKEKDLFATLLKRKSTRSFKDIAIGEDILSQILFFSAGIHIIKKSQTRRFYPSGGARYPLETYVVILRKTKNFSTGLYHYDVKHHALEYIPTNEPSKVLEEIGGEMNKDVLLNASILFIVTAVFGRTEIKYGKTSYRIILLEAGHLAQNIQLVSTALGINSCMIGGYVDDKLNTFLRLDEEKEQSLYIVALGK